MPEKVCVSLQTDTTYSTDTPGLISSASSPGTSFGGKASFYHEVHITWRQLLVPSHSVKQGSNPTRVVFTAVITMCISPVIFSSPLTSHSLAMSTYCVLSSRDSLQVCLTPKLVRWQRTSPLPLRWQRTSPQDLPKLSLSLGLRQCTKARAKWH